MMASGSLSFHLLLLLAFTIAKAQPAKKENDGHVRVMDGFVDNGETVSWTVEPSYRSASVSDKLLSFNLDWHPQVEGAKWGQNASCLTIDLDNPTLRAVTAALSPAYLRIGGSEGDDAVYDIDGACSRTRGGSGIPPPEFCLSTTRWKELLEFASDVGIEVVFGLNVMYGRNCTKRCEPQPCCSPVSGPCSKWDPSNALALLNYTASLGLPIGGFEVGNEKEHVLDPQDYANCIGTIRRHIDLLWPDDASNGKKPLLIGPDENPRADWLAFMLQSGGDLVDVVTYHLYPGYGLDPNLREELLEPAFLDFTRVIASEISSVVRERAPNSDVWVGETAAAWHSGQAGVTDAFESGFWFIDQLGTVSSLSQKVMCRQCLVGGDYSMLGVNDGFLPKPDYWVALLWKRLMGVDVIFSHQSEPASSSFVANVRGYLHCSTDSSQSPGATTFAFLNVDQKKPYTISFEGVNTDGSKFDTSTRVEYILTSDTLSSPSVRLNGDLLELQDGQIPVIKGKYVSHGELEVPPLSYGFVHFPYSKASGCT